MVVTAVEYQAIIDLLTFIAGLHIALIIAVAWRM